MSQQIKWSKIHDPTTFDVPEPLNVGSQIFDMYVKDEQLWVVTERGTFPIDARLLEIPEPPK